MTAPNAPKFSLGDQSRFTANYLSNLSQGPRVQQWPESKGHQNTNQHGFRIYDAPCGPISVVTELASKKPLYPCVFPQICPGLPSAQIRLFPLAGAAYSQPAQSDKSPESGEPSLPMHPTKKM